MEMPFIDTHRPPPLPVTRTSGKAIWSLVLGVASLVCAFVTGLPAILFGVLALGDIGRSQGKLTGRGLAIAGIVIGTVGCLLGLVAVVQVYVAARQASQRMTSQYNLKQISLAVLNYHDVYYAIPPAGSDDPQVGLNMSWRVRLLPFIEQKALHDQVNYREPWDSPANSALLPKMPSTYAVPPAVKGSSETSYLAFTAPQPVQAGDVQGMPFFGSGLARGDGFPSIQDGTTNTIMIVEADRDRAVPWMKAADLKLDAANPKAGLGHVRTGGFIVVMGDGSVKFIPNTIDSSLLLKLILRDDGHEAYLE